MEEKASKSVESIQFNEDDISELKKKSKESKFEINHLQMKLLYLETCSRRENVKFFGVDEVVPASEVDSPTQGYKRFIAQIPGKQVSY